MAWFVHHLVTVYVVLAATAVAGIAQCGYLLLAVPSALATLGYLGIRWSRREHA